MEAGRTPNDGIEESKGNLPPTNSNYQSQICRNDDSFESQTRTRRLFSFVQLFAFSLTYLSVWEGMCTYVPMQYSTGEPTDMKSRNMYFALYNGGSSTFFWSVIIVVICASAQAASLAEMASLQPVAGAQYHWTYHLAHPKIKRFATWLQGWSTWCGYVSILAGILNVQALILESMIQLNYENYVPKGWHTSLLVIASAVSFGLVNIYTFKLIPWVEVAEGVLHVILFVVFVAVMIVLGNQHTSEFVFLETSISSGWENRYISWNLGMLTCIWSFTSFDSAIHMAEETRKSRSAVPRAMFWSIVMNGVLAVAMVLVILFTMGTIEEALGSPIPIITILSAMTGSRSATTAMVAGLFINTIGCTIACIASVSRLTWAWARDGGLPHYFAYVHPKRRVPVRAVCLVVVLVCLICLLNISGESYIAFGAITALGSIALYISYAIALTSIIYSRWATPGLRLGEWNLGRWGGYINVFALIWTLYVIIFLPIPSTLPVTAANMNYAGPIIVFMLATVIGLWFLRARRHWAGPNMTILEIVMAKS